MEVSLPLRDINVSEKGDNQQQKPSKLQSEDTENISENFLNLRSRRSNMSIGEKEQQQQQTSTQDDFELAIKENYVEKDAKTDLKENEHDSAMATSEDENEANSMQSSEGGDDCCIITHSEEDEPDIKEVEADIKVDEPKSKEDKPDIEKKSMSDTDNVKDLVIVDKLDTFKVGDVAWVGFTKNHFWPAIIISFKGENVSVRYFSDGICSLLPIKNVICYCSFDDLLKLLKEKKLPKKHYQQCLRRFNNPNFNRGVEEAKFFLTIDVEKRIELYTLFYDKAKEYKRKCKPLLSIDNYENVPEHLTELLQNLIEVMKAYDEKHVKPSKDWFELAITSDSFNNIPKAEPVARGTQSDASEKIRHSTREKFKRRLSYTPSETSNSQESVKPPAPKRPKLKVEFEEKFIIAPKTISNLFKTTEVNRTCVECQVKKLQNDETMKCSDCNLYFHKTCSYSVEPVKGQIRHLTGDSELIILIDQQETEETKEILTCNSCVNMSSNCSLCRKPLSEKPTENYSCTYADCKHSYHIQCLMKCPQSKGKRSCPQHSCHTCFSKNINKTGTLVKCVKCPTTYHGDIFCLPAGSQVISKNKIICPRHPLKKENSLPLNINNCDHCNGGGELVCCDSCPKAYHANCLPEGSNLEDVSFYCDDCRQGIMPLYNTCVFAKVGAYRWWPGYILTPSQAEGIATSNLKVYPRHFCVRFFGDYNHAWFPHERVLVNPISLLQSNLKNRSSTDLGYKTAIDEYFRMKGILDTNCEENIKHVPKPYKKIQVNRLHESVKLKKKELHEPCSCSFNENSPCGISSDCIVRKLNYECSRSCPAGEKCQNQKMQKREYAEMEIFSTKNRGFGARAKHDIKEGEFVIEYVGELINNAEMMKRVKQKSERNDNQIYFFNIDPDVIIDAEPCGNNSRFINHSCKPNCTSLKINVDGHDRVGIFALHDIEAGTELTFNYKFGQTGNDFTCLCGSENCSGSLGGKNVQVKKEHSTSESSQNKRKNMSRKEKSMKIKIKQERKEQTQVKVASIAEFVEAPDPLEVMMDIM